MLPFFRKIRYRLAEDNQFFKYLKYAVGEIVLVVLGILIALQINNWNEDRSDKTKKQVFKNALIEDLKKDTAHLKFHNKNSQEKIKFYSEFIAKLEKSDATVDTIINIFTLNEIPTNITTNPPNKSTYESLISTGNIKLFNNSEIKVIMDFYNNREAKYLLIRQSNDRILERGLLFYDEFGWLLKEEKNNIVYKTLRQNMDEKEFLRMIDLWIYRMLDLTQINKSNGEELLHETNELLKTLENESR